MEHIDINIFNNWAKKHITDESKFGDDGFIIMENNENYKSTGIIAQIFKDHWDNYYARYHKKLDEIRPNCSMEVQKIIDCANHNSGANVYVCPKCDEAYFCHHTCKGKLCSSCGIKTQKIVTQNILEKTINSKHRHIIFTIPACLRHFFFEDLHTTDLLFDAVADTIYSIVNGKVKKKKSKDGTITLFLVSILFFILLVDL